MASEIKKVTKGKLQKTLGDTQVLDRYETIKCFHPTVPGTGFEFSNKEEVLLQTNIGQFCFTTDIPNLKKRLEDLADGWLQEEMMHQMRIYHKQNKEYFDPILKSPDMRANLENILRSKMWMGDYLASVENDALGKIKRILQKTPGKRNLYETLESAYKNSNASGFNKLVETYEKNLCSIDENVSKIKTDNEMTADFKRQIAVGRIVLNYLKILNNIRNITESEGQNFPCADFSEFVCARNIARIPVEDAKYILGKFNKALSYFDNRNEKADFVLFPREGDCLYIGNERNLLKIGLTDKQDSMKKVYKTIVT